MATEQVHHWIQNDVRLSKIVSSFETDFSNGYLFGEIFKQYQYVEDISSFSKKANKESKVKNFAQVENVLRQLKIKFDAKLINQIMNEERGAALRLLFQIKLGIQKDNPQEFNIQSQTKTMTNIDQQKLNKRFEEVMQLKTTLPMTNKFQTMNKSKKLEAIEKTLLKFEYTKKNQDDKAYSDQKQEENLIKRLQQDQRQFSMTKMTENRQFMKDWEQEGKKNWSLNQQKRTETIDRQQYFEDLEVKAFKNKLNKDLNEATKDMMGGIDEFEMNLQKLGIEKNTNIEDAVKRMEEKKGIPPGQIQNFSYAATMNKIKENKNLQDFAAKERDRRRRKMIVDQSRTQNNLDKKKNEEQLIQKLMKKQSEEQQFAYLEWRNQQCKQLIIKNREDKAMVHEERKQVQMLDLENKRNEEHAAMIDGHKKSIQEQKKYYQQVRRQEKLQKRMLNVEICSEVMDLILDVANETFEQTTKHNKKKLDKPEWREWMNIFVDNKLVSSVVGDHHNNLSLSLADDDLTKDQNYDPLQDANKQLEDILEEMKFDAAYEDLLQYLSITGMFNLNTGDFSNEWGQIKDVNFLEGINMNFNFLDSLIPPSNPELGRNFKQLLMNLWQVDRSAKEEDIKTEDIISIPHYLPLKLCILGKKYSGKRTIAKQISELYQNKIKVFRMEDLIKNCFDYVNPKPQAVEQDKGKKPQAKKTEEAIPQDEFAGQDTKEYKEIGHQLKAILGESFDFTQSSSQDLVSMITDDNLLIRLFIQKLKLSFPVEKSEQARIEEIKQNILREKDILEQLQDIEQSNTVAGGVIDKKGGKAPVAKGKNVASNEDQLRLELDQVQKVQPEGWVLLDFPRTLTQAKLMEKLMTGFTSVMDQSKELNQKKYEQWSKLVTPSDSEDTQTSDLNPRIYKSASDAIVFIETTSDECFRRSNNRKIDPTTGMIYHLEDNPPPENDNKLKDRLQEYTDPEAEPTKMNHHHQVYDDNCHLLKKWISGFGLEEEFVQPVNSLVDIQIAQGHSKSEVWDKVQSELQRILGFKQSQYDNKKVKVYVLINEEANQVQQEQLIQQELLQQQQQDDYIAPEQEQQVQEQELNVQEQQEQAITQQDLQAQKPRSQNGYSSQSQRLKSEYKSEKLPQPLSNDDKKDIWQNFEHSYYIDCLTVFKVIKRQRDLVLDGLHDTQTRFIDYLSRSDSKTQKIHEFIESFNKFSDEFPDLREDEQTKEELLKRVDVLSNELWTVIEQRRDEAIEERSKILSIGWIDHELKKLIKNATVIQQNEMNKFYVIYNLIVGSEAPSIIQVEDEFNRAVNDGNEAFESSGKSPLLNMTIATILKNIQYNMDNLQDVEPESQKMLQIESQNLIFRLNMIQTWIILKLKDFYNYSDQVFEAIDDWISISVSEENLAIQNVISKLRDAVFDQELRLDYHAYNVDQLDLYSKIAIVEYNSQQSVIQPELESLAKSFKVEHLEILYRDMRYYSFDKYLDGQTFIHQIVLCLKENRVPARWRNYEFSMFNNILQKFSIMPLGQEESGSKPLYTSRQEDEKSQSQRQFIDWKKVYTMFILLQTNMRTEGEVYNEYESLLNEHQNERGEITLQNFLKVEAWFDNTDCLPDIKLDVQHTDEDDYDEPSESQPALIDHDRHTRVKTLLFNTHQNNTRVVKVSDYIQCLRDIQILCNGVTCYQALFNE